MPAPLSIARGNQLFDTCIVGTFTPPASIPTTGVTYATYTVPGLALLDYISISIQSAVTTFSITNAYVSAVNTLSIGFSSETGATVSGAAAFQALLEVARCENGNLGFSALPTVIQ